MKSPHPQLPSLILAGVLMTACTGCVYVAVGALGVVGGYVVSPDTVEGSTSNSFDETMDAVREVAGIMGQIVEESPNGSMMVAMISGTRVTVTLSAVNLSTTKISVKARKSFMPKIDIAQDVYTKIIRQMER